MAMKSVPIPPGDAILDRIIHNATASSSKATVYGVMLAKRKNVSTSRTIANLDQEAISSTLKPVSRVRHRT